MTPFEWLAIGTAVASLTTGVISLINSKRNQDIQEKTNEQIMAREDNAVQRRKADLIAAGYNPVLAPGSAANTSGLQAPTFDGDFSLVNNALGAVSQVAQVEQTRSQTRLLKEQQTSVANQNALFDLDKQIKEEQLRGARQLTRERSISADEKSYNLGLYKESGMPTNASMPGKMVNEATNATLRAGRALKDSASSALSNIKTKVKEGYNADVSRFKDYGGKVKNYASGKIQGAKKWFQNNSMSAESAAKNYLKK